MTLPTIEIRGTKYPEPAMDRMKRKAVKKLKPLLTRLQDEDLDALWDLVGAMVPDLPAKDLDDLDMGECKDILTVAGVAKFNTEADPDITAGESSASTNS